MSSTTISQSSAFASGRRGNENGGSKESEAPECREASCVTDGNFLLRELWRACPAEGLGLPQLRAMVQRRTVPPVRIRRRAEALWERMSRLRLPQGKERHQEPDDAPAGSERRHAFYAASSGLGLHRHCGLSPAGAWALSRADSPRDIAIEPGLSSPPRSSCRPDLRSPRHRAIRPRRQAPPRRRRFPSA